MGFICVDCGYEGKGKKILRGSTSMEVILWASLLVPGPFYSFWRRFKTTRKCPHCNRCNMVSTDSNTGWVIKAQLEKELSQPKTSVHKLMPGISLIGEEAPDIVPHHTPDIIPSHAAAPAPATLAELPLTPPAPVSISKPPPDPDVW